MKIALEGTTFCVAGTFDKYENTRGIEELLRKGGAEVMKSMGLKVEALVYGSGYTTKLAAAEGRGLPVLREADLDALLLGGAVEVDFELPTVEGGAASIDELLGEVRGVLAQAPSPALWGRIVELVNQCELDQAGPLVDYVDGHIERWPERAQSRCLAPRAWTLAMLQGQDTPAYGLVRCVDLSGMHVNTTAFKKLLGCAHLTRLTSLGLSTHDPLTKTAYKALARNPRFQAIEELALDGFEAEHVAELDAHAPGSGLRRLRCHEWSMWVERSDRFAALFGLRVCARVDTLALRVYSGSKAGEIFAELADDSKLPAFEHLEVDQTDRGGGGSAMPLNGEVLSCVIRDTPDDARRRVKTLTVRTNVDGHYRKEGILNVRQLKNLRTLRLFDAGAYRRDDVTLEDFDRVFHAHELRLPDSLERIVTNAPLDRGAFARLIQARPDLEVVQDPDEAPFAG